MYLAEIFFPFSVLAAGNSCLIMPLQIQLLGRSRRRHNLKHKLKIRQKVIWKFGGKLKGKQQSWTWATNTKAIFMFSQQNHSKHELKVSLCPTPFPLRRERLMHQQLTQREGERRAPPSGISSESGWHLRCHTQTGMGLTKISVLVSSSNPYLQEI